MKFPASIAAWWDELDSRSRLMAGYVLIALLAAALAWGALADRVERLERKRVDRETALKELMSLRAAYRRAKQSADNLTSRMSTVRTDDSPAKVIEESGIKGKGLKITPRKGEERNGVQEDVAEARIDGLTANEAVNLLYRLEKGGRPLFLKKANLRVRFDDPSRLDLELTLALLKPVPGSVR